VPVIYGVLYDSGGLYKDAVFGSMTIYTRIMCVSGVCVCWMGVYVLYEQIQTRGVKARFAPNRHFFSRLHLDHVSATAMLLEQG
jgi:hypothetical protein